MLATAAGKGLLSAAREGSPRSPTGAMASLSLAVLLSSLGTSIANVGLPAFARAFSAPFQAVQWVVLAYLLAVTALIVSVGRLGDRVGRRRLLLAGIAVFAVASAICGLAPSLGVLIAARAAQGFGAAAMMALGMALLGESVPTERTGRAMGLLGTMSAVGTALGPTLGGMLISAIGWRAIFLVKVPVAILALVLAHRFLPGDRTVARARTGSDPLGALLLTLTLSAYALAMTLGRGRFGRLNVVLLGAAVIGAIVFVGVEARASSPLVRLSMLREPGLGAALAMSALVSMVIMATLVVGPFYLSRGLGLDAAGVGLVMSVGPLVAALMGVPSGRIVDRSGAPRMSVVGLGGLTCGSTLLAVLPGTAGVPGYVAPLAVMTAGYALFQTANNTAVMRDVGADRSGVVSGLLNLSRNVGLISGASVMGAVFAWSSGARDITTAPAAAVHGGLRFTFAVGAALAVGALGIAVRESARAAARRPSGRGGREDSRDHGRRRVESNPHLASRNPGVEAGNRSTP